MGPHMKVRRKVGKVSEWRDAHRDVGRSRWVYPSGDESSSSVPTVRATAQPFSMRVKERLR